MLYLTPKKYKTPEELQKAVNDYFENPTHSDYRTNADGDREEVPIYTVCGLALALGFADRQSIYDYINRKDNMSCIIKAAKLFIENEYEVSLRKGNVAGVIFALKNMGWKDKQEVKADVTHTGFFKQIIDKAIPKEMEE